MSTWSVELIGEPVDLEDLAHWFTQPELNVTRDHHGFQLASSEFAECADASDVISCAERLRTHMLGPACLFRRGFGPIVLGAVVKTDADGTRHTSVRLTEGAKSSSRVYAPTILTGDNTPAQVPPPGQWAAISLKDPTVAHALRLRGAPQADWFRLYKVWEVIEADVGGDVYSRGWATKSEAGRFTRTANSAAALGDAARHAKDRSHPPRNPMTLEEATNFIDRALRLWLLAKAGD
jgi:hypothetical protein